MTIERLKKELQKHHIKFNMIKHSPAYTAQDVAQISHVAADKMAKSVIINMGDSFIMAVVPSNKKINIDALKKITHSTMAHVANEQEFADKFPDCEIGAMPPFGNLYNLKVYVDDALSKNAELAFNAGSHSEIMKMDYKDFEDLVKPIHGKFTS